VIAPPQSWPSAFPGRAITIELNRLVLMTWPVCARERASKLNEQSRLKQMVGAHLLMNNCSQRWIPTFVAALLDSLRRQNVQRG